MGALPVFISLICIITPFVYSKTVNKQDGYQNQDYLESNLAENLFRIKRQAAKALKTVNAVKPLRA